MAVYVTVYAPGETLRCPNVNAGGWRCDKAFGEATQTIAVTVITGASVGDMVHLCRGCRARLDIFLGAVVVARVA